MKKGLLLLMAILSFLPLCAVTSVSELSDFPKFCLEASKNPALFPNFRREPLIRAVIDTVSYEQGRECASLTLKQTPEFTSKLDLVRQNDKTGNPFVFSYGDLGTFCPTTLRYLKVASDCKKLFGSLDNFRIVEIGGGYGGQCAVFSKLFNLKSYTIIDLPGPLELTRKYLSEQGINNVTFLTPDQVTGAQIFDLSISNYAFTECNGGVQREYLEKVFLKSRRGYLLCNPPAVIPPGSIYASMYTKQQLMQELKNKNFACKELAETPLTSSTNYLLVWQEATKPR